MQHSEPLRRKDSVRGEELEDLYKKSSSKWQEIDEEFAFEVFMRAAETVEEEPIRRLVDEAGQTRKDLLAATQRLLSPIGLNLVIVGSRG